MNGVTFAEKQKWIREFRKRHPESRGAVIDSDSYYCEGTADRSESSAIPTERCSYCGRKAFEVDITCGGCGAPL